MLKAGPGSGIRELLSKAQASLLQILASVRMIAGSSLLIAKALSDNPPAKVSEGDTIAKAIRRVG